MTQLTDDQKNMIYEMWLKREPQTTIAHVVGCNRNTVGAVIRKTTSGLAQARREQSEQARAESLASYDALIRDAWKSAQVCDVESTTRVGYLNVIRSCLQQRDKINGLEKVTVEHRGLDRIDALLTEPVTIVLPGGEDVAST